MWKLTALNGELKGQIFSLSTGANIIGRSANCDIRLPLDDISKKHLKIEVFENQLLVTDLESRNGTYVDGIKIRSRVIQHGQKLILHKTIFLLENNGVATIPIFNDQHDDSFESEPNIEDSEAQSTQNLVSNKFTGFMDKHVLPGAYKLPQLLGFEWSIAALLAILVCISLFSSYLPVMGVIHANTTQETQNTALSLARSIKNENINYLNKGMNSSININSIFNEPRVSKAYLISKDGRIIAPSSLSGERPKEPFVATVTNSNKELTKKLNSGKIAASTPIQFYNPNTQQKYTKAYAVVVLNSKPLTAYYSLIIAKVVQSLFISLIFLAFISFILIKIINRPIEAINNDFSNALREGGTSVDTIYGIKSLKQMASNINSALNRIDNPDNNQALQTIYDRSSESQNLVQLIGFPAMSINAESLIIQNINSSLEEKMDNQFLYSNIDDINDQAFKLSIQDLIETCIKSPEQLASNNLEFNGEDSEVTCQAIWGKQEISYFIITILPQYFSDEEGDAA